MKVIFWVVKNTSKSVHIEGTSKVNFNGSANKLANKVKRGKVPMEYQVKTEFSKDNKASIARKAKFNPEQRAKLANTAIKSGALVASAAGLTNAIGKAFMPSNNIFGTNDKDDDDKDN